MTKTKAAPKPERRPLQDERPAAPPAIPDDALRTVLSAYERRQYAQRLARALAEHRTEPLTKLQKIAKRISRFYAGLDADGAKDIAIFAARHYRTPEAQARYIIAEDADCTLYYALAWVRSAEYDPS